MLALLEREGPAAVADEMIPKLLGERTRREQPDLADVLHTLIEQNVPEGIATAIRAMKDRRDSTDLLGQIGCPTLVIVGEEDVLTPPADSRALQQGIPGARLQTIPGAGHLSNLEDPAAFSRALGEFLSTLTAARA
jgi:pimeloyl-ACP methyl ester carboxylesterase